MSNRRTFAGFGFGPIQMGLFVYEAFSSGNFDRFVIAEVDKSLVKALRDNDGRCFVNIARPDRIDRCELSGIELRDPNDPADRAALVEAISQASEIATCLPSVRFYDSDPANGVAAILAESLGARSDCNPTVIYAAENNNTAAEILMREVLGHARPDDLCNVQTLNTVIGKMSGVITDPDVIDHMGLKTITPGIDRAVLVEEFNHILVSRVTLKGFARGIDVFIEKDDLLPFEEAKLYGHNAIHAMMGYLAEMRGFEVMSQVSGDEWILSHARKAFIEESGAMIIARHSHLGDALFTPEGYANYADDLLKRMVNPNLNDLVDRVGRDHLRKLSFEDRLFGTMSLALEAGVRPVELSLGSAAGMISLVKRRNELKTEIPDLPTSPEGFTRCNLGKSLRFMWGDKATARSDELVDLTWQSIQTLLNG